MSKSGQPSLTRRGFLKTSTVVAVGAAAGFGGLSVPLLKKDRLLLRPPGALDEDLFLASCIKCGQCLQVCPPQVIRLADIWQGFGIGTPYIVPREGGCILCSGLPCVLACPTGALDHHLSLGKDAEMGLAVLSSPDTCLAGKGVNDLVHRLEQLRRDDQAGMDMAELQDIVTGCAARLSPEEKQVWQDHFSLPEISEQTLPELVARFKPEDIDWLGEFLASSSLAKTSCRVCLDTCPIREEQPIVFTPHREGGPGAFLPSVQKTCVGCGVCEEKCPTALPSITIVPRLKWSENGTTRQEEDGAA